jgi:hypothetical protein
MTQLWIHPGVVILGGQDDRHEIVDRLRELVGLGHDDGGGFNLNPRYNIAPTRTKASILLIKVGGAGPLITVCATGFARFSSVHKCADLGWRLLNGRNRCFRCLGLHNCARSGGSITL